MTAVPLGPVPARTKCGGLTAREAGGAVISGLLEAEQDLRQMAEQTVQDLCGALRLAAYTFAGEAFEEVVRADQVAIERWSADEWIAFFQKAAPVGQGWNDAKVLAERLMEMTAERDELLATVADAKSRLVLLEERLRDEASSRDAASSLEAPPAVLAATEREVKMGGGRELGRGPKFRWPDVPARPPAKYTRQIGGDWKRKGIALGLIASGISLRIEAQRLLAWRVGCKEDSSSIRKVFERLERAGLFEGECVRVHLASTRFLWLTRLGQEVSEICRFDLRETDYQRLLRLHGGEKHKQHAAEAATFVYQARRRDFLVEVMPDVDGPAEPDVVISKEGERSVYVEVETEGDREARWRHQVDLQGFVAVCGVTESQQERMVARLKDLGLPGRATNLEALMQDKEGAGNLWLEEWKS
ncbi:MAG: hypothetical protein JW918_12800 [Anaerolineae bacterium]|nr:hypothetical protein [Anaerolineae bacterium]